MLLQSVFPCIQKIYMDIFEAEWLCGEKIILALESDRTEYKY